MTILLAVKTLFSLILCLCVSYEQLDKGIRAKIIGVVDGDTVHALVKGNKSIKIRLTHIDAPESGQAYGKKAKQLLSNLCYLDSVTLTDTLHKDRYGRILAELILDNGKIANQIMLDSGLAWHYKYYSSDMVYDSLERNARNLKRGLWQDTNAVAPWDWRR